MTNASAQAPTDARRFEHSVLCYRDDDEFVGRVGGFVREGVERGEAVLVAEPTRRLEQLRDAVGDADNVKWLDMTEVGVNPARIIPVWEDFVAANTAAGRPMRGVGEPGWPGRRPVEYVECRLHELLLNQRFGGGPGWQLLCPYDAPALPDEVVAEALHTHPLEHDGSAAEPTPSYDERRIRDAFASPLPPPPAEAQTIAYDGTSLEQTRAALDRLARACGLPRVRREDLLLAGWEVAVNSVRHGGGHGRLSLWRQPDALVAEFEDAGLITDTLVGRRRPPLGAPGGRGVYLANQLCDLVQLRSSPTGTVVRLVTWL